MDQKFFSCPLGCQRFTIPKQLRGRLKWWLLASALGLAVSSTGRTTPAKNIGVQGSERQLLLLHGVNSNY